MIWVSWHLRPSWPTSRDTLRIYVSSVGRAHPDDLSLPAIHFNLRAAALCPSATLRCFSILAKELSKIACDMHGKTFSRNDLKHTKDSNWSIPIIISICFVGFDKAIIRFPGFPPSIGFLALPGTSKNRYAMMQAWEKTPSLAACSQPKPSLGARKMEPRCLERQKRLRCGAEKNRRCRSVSKHLR